MYKNSEAINRDIDSSDVNSDDADKFSGDESDDENPPRSFVNPSYNERQMNSCKNFHLFNHLSRINEDEKVDVQNCGGKTLIFAFVLIYMHHPR